MIVFNFLSPFFCAPSGWGGSDFFFVVIFGRQHGPAFVWFVCGGWCVRCLGRMVDALAC